jgi:hypothetical protein
VAIRLRSRSRPPGRTWCQYVPSAIRGLALVHPVCPEISWHGCLRERCRAGPGVSTSRRFPPSPAQKMAFRRKSLVPFLSLLHPIGRPFSPVGTSVNSQRAEALGTRPPPPTKPRRGGRSPSPGKSPGETGTLPTVLSAQRANRSPEFAASHHPAREPPSTDVLSRRRLRGPLKHYERKAAQFKMMSLDCPRIHFGSSCPERQGFETECSGFWRILNPFEGGRVRRLTPILIDDSV